MWAPQTPPGRPDLPFHLRGGFQCSLQTVSPRGTPDHGGWHEFGPTGEHFGAGTGVFNDKEPKAFAPNAVLVGSLSTAGLSGETFQADCMWMSINLPLIFWLIKSVRC